jgi:hypothetical protein
MERIIFAEWKKELDAELSKGAAQEELQQAVKEGDSDYRESVERSERGLEGDNLSLEQEAAVKQRVDIRMMTESPILMQKKLRNEGGKIVVDHDTYAREKKKKEFMEF